MSDDTLFDKILRKEIPAEVVYEDESVLAFYDINPQAPVHVLVVPKARFCNVSELKDGDAETVGRFMMGVSHVAEKLGLTERGYRVVFNTGPDALQTVEYLHAHILGGRSMEWPPG
ncbi:MAG: histidine triad nucleotide-binding protein [Spirochaeta sp.]|nr:histidine triad nucleotide-binding protein [Spirochaeta sp.]